MERAAADEGDEHDDVRVLEGVDALQKLLYCNQGTHDYFKLISIEGDFLRTLLPPEATES